MRRKGGFHDYKEFVIICSILFVALALRFYRLGSHDFWHDEIYSVIYAQNPWGNPNAPLYWVFLHFWTKVFGVSEFILRLPSLIFSFLAVLLTFLLGKNLFGKKAGILAGMLIALSPFQLWYAQEARDYSMALFVATLSTNILFAAMKGGTLKRWACYVLVSITGLYTNYFYILLIIAQGVFFFAVKKPRPSLKDAVPFLVICLGFSLYLPRFLDKFSFVRQGFWVGKPTLASIGITLENFMVGYNAPRWLYTASDVLEALLFIYALKALSRKELRTPVLLCLFLLLLPILSAFIFSELLFPVYLDRGLIIVTPYLYLILSLGVTRMPAIMRGALFGLLLSALLLADHNFFKDLMPAGLYHHRGVHIKMPVKTAVKFLRDHLLPGDIIAFTNRSVEPSMQFYLNEKQNRCYRIFTSQGVDDAWRRAIIPQSDFEIPLQKIGSLDAKRIWVVASPWERTEALDGNSLFIKDYLDKKFKLEFSKEFNGLWVFRYARR